MSYSNYEKLLNMKKSTSYKVAKATGIAPSTLSDWKNGRSVPKADKMRLIADYFGVDISKLVGDDVDLSEISLTDEEERKTSPCFPSHSIHCFSSSSGMFCRLLILEATPSLHHSFLLLMWVYSSFTS